ncbi:membrane protein FxsA [Siminovitchia acidinfaciens]|uniref:Membrane protein FxsA n=1 Tax=Siminovitchia acidinfaciens TaxID=2321395 RepID=A0A429Y4R1_9BACI|nr:FxsA family protein [Siminovitchia acidinfaciens]RST76357.1 membrane protein FxsA [Siminovitchia acidinfaciens]
MRFLFLLFIVVPALEIGLFILAGKTVGGFATIALIIITGILGAYLAKRQGMEVIRKMQEQVRSGYPPGEALLEGVCVLVGGLLLVTPGFITDITGLFLVLPPTRKLLQPALLKLFKSWISRKQIYIYR